MTGPGAQVDQVPLLELPVQRKWLFQGTVDPWGSALWSELPCDVAEGQGPSGGSVLLTNLFCPSDYWPDHFHPDLCVRAPTEREQVDCDGSLFTLNRESSQWPPSSQHTLSVSPVILSGLVTSASQGLPYRQKNEGQWRNGFISSPSLPTLCPFQTFHPSELLVLDGAQGGDRASRQSEPLTLWACRSLGRWQSPSAP